MGLRFEELDWQRTPMGEISLRRRVDPTLGVDVYEVTLGEEFLMSSLFTVAEIELARRGLAETPGDDLAVLVGGLGLGYTAAATLEDPRMTALTVVDAIAPVIDWHRRGLLPDTHGLASDPRVRLVQGDFFALVAGDHGFGAGTPAEYDAILLDIDHTPRHLLNPEPRALLHPRRAHLADEAPQTRRRLRALVRRPAGPGVPRGDVARLLDRTSRRRDVPEPPHPRTVREHRVHRNLLTTSQPLTGRGARAHPANTRTPPVHPTTRIRLTAVGTRSPPQARPQYWAPNPPPPQCSPLNRAAQWCYRLLRRNQNETPLPCRAKFAVAPM